MENNDTQKVKFSIIPPLALLCLGIYLWISVPYNRYYYRIGEYIYLSVHILINLIWMLPNSNYLLITPKGMVFRIFYTFGKLTPWSDYQGFEVKRGFLFLKSIYFKHTEAYKAQKKPSRYGEGVPGIFFSMKPEELADLLNNKRAEYLGLGKK